MKLSNWAKSVTDCIGWFHARYDDNIKMGCPLSVSWRCLCINITTIWSIADNFTLHVKELSDESLFLHLPLLRTRTYCKRLSESEKSKAINWNYRLNRRMIIMEEHMASSLTQLCIIFCIKREFSINQWI
mgnify:CR=1 FL=1